MQLPRWLKEQLPYKSRFIEIDGYNMHYLDEGRGPVVLLLHGNPTWCFYYRHLIRLLSRDFRVIAPDYIGCGLSDRTPGKAFRATDRIRQVSELIDALGIERFSLVMHDWGGSIGTSVAVERPEKIDKLVYLNTTLTETEALPLVIRLAANRITGKFLTKYTKKFVKLTTKLGVCSKLPREVRDAYLYPYRKISQRSAIWDFVADIPFDQDHPSYAAMLELAEKLPRLSHVPVKIVWGLRDPCFHREMLGKVARHFPQADILEIPDASHLVLEDASEEANQAIYEFLSDETIEVKDVTPGVQGGEVTSAEVSEHVLFKRLREQAREHPFRPAVVEPLYLADSIRYRHVSYQAFYDLTNKYQRGLTALGLERGDRVLMLVSPGEDFLALSYAVMGRGAIPFFVDPGMGRENLFRTIEEIDPQILIGSPKAHLLRILKKKLFSRLKFHITASTWIYTGGPNLSYLKKFAPQPLPAVSAPEVALVAYTSGATGAPKGVIYTGAMLAEQLRIFSDVFKLQAGNKDLPLLPVFSLFNLAAGVCSVFPPLDPARPLSFDPEKIVKIVNELGINYSFGSPTLWTKISEYCVRSRETLPSLERVFIAGAAVSADTLKLVKSIVPAGEVFTPYGATEALPVTLVSAVEITGLDPESAAGGEQGTYVGKPVDGIDLKVIKPVDGPIDDISEAVECAPDEIGEVIVRGRNVSPHYFRRKDADRRSKITDQQGFWHRMGDMGYLGKGGGLYFCGRKAHRVIHRDRVYYSVPVEKIFNEHPRVRRSALVDLGPQRGPAVVIEPFPQHWPESAEEKEQFIAELKELGLKSAVTADIKYFYFHESFPVDGRHNAKIFRDKLGEWARKHERIEIAA